MSGGVVGKHLTAAAVAAGLVAWNSLVLPKVPARHRAAANAGAAVAAGAVARRWASPGQLGWTWSPAVGRAAMIAAVAPAPLWVATAMAVRRAPDRAPLPEDLRHPAEWLLWRIPVGTALAEELFFRSVLFTFGSPVVSAAAFGLWHVRSARAAGQPVAAVLTTTTAAGLVFDMLRAHTGSVLVPMALHASINLGGAVPVVWAQRDRSIDAAAESE